jgi:hypothetical protein
MVGQLGVWNFLYTLYYKIIPVTELLSTNGYEFHFTVSLGLDPNCATERDRTSNVSAAVTRLTYMNINISNKPQLFSRQAGRGLSCRVSKFWPTHTTLSNLTTI